MKKIYKSPKVGQSFPAAHKIPEDKVKLPNLPNSLVMRVMEESGAEQEADKLSAGVTSTTPDDLREEMGSRLGADFSNVQFHTDSLSMNRSQALGARAWAQGSDVYFGRGGFDPKVAAHELVHTIQQGAVRGNVSQSMPMGVVQMKPEDEEDSNKQKRIGKDADLAPILTQAFSTELGTKIYNNLKKPLFNLIKKGAGSGFRSCDVSDAVKFLTLATERDYSARGILTQILENPVNEAKDARERLFEYENYIKFLSTRVHEIDLEEAAVAANVKKGPLKYRHKDNKIQKRAYELDMPDIKSGKIDYNPTDNDALEKVQKEIDNARNAKEAYRIFGRFAGNAGASFSDPYNTDLNLPKFKTKLKNMVRVIYDYPELKGQIGNMSVIGRNNAEYMGAVGNYGGRKKAYLEYNAFYDSNDPEGEKLKKRLINQSKIYFNGSEDYVGNHELGHIMASTLNEGKNNYEASDIQNDHIIEEQILENVLQNPEIMDPEEYKNLVRYTDKRVKDKEEKFGQHVLKGQIDLSKSHLPSSGYTSEYGGQNSAEFFAEAVHDVYANGNKAKQASIAAVQEYEKRQKKVTKNKFFKQKRGFFRRFLDLFKF